MSEQVRFRRGTTAQIASFTGADGEGTFDTEKKCLVLRSLVLCGLGALSWDGSFAPDGAWCGGGREPSDESLGYFRASFRDFWWGWRVGQC